MENKAEYIDRRDLLQRLPQDLPYKASVKRVLEQAPCADVAPVEETVKGFAKFLIDKAECGAIHLDDIADLCYEFLGGRTMSYDELTHCDECEFHDECELADGVNFCEECRHCGGCLIKDGYCLAGHAVECNNGFEPYGYMYDDLYDEESEDEE